MNKESTKQTANQGIILAASVAVGAVLMVSCASSPQEATAPTAIGSPAPQRGFEVVNVMSDFWRFWEMAKDKPPPTQQALFKKYVIEKHPELFTRDVLGLKKTVPYDEALEIKLDWYFKQLPGLVPAMKRLSGILQARLTQYMQSFRAAFPDFSYTG